MTRPRARTGTQPRTEMVGGPPQETESREHGAEVGALRGRGLQAVALEVTRRIALQNSRRSTRERRSHTQPPLDSVSPREATSPRRTGTLARMLPDVNCFYFSVGAMTANPSAVGANSRTV